MVGIMRPPFWQLKNFNRHLTYPHLQMTTERGGACSFWEKKFIPCFAFWAIKEFWSSPNNVGVLDGY